MRYPNLRTEILNTLSATHSQVQPTVSYAGDAGRKAVAYVDANNGTGLMSAQSRSRFLNRVKAILSGRFVVKTERRPSGQPVLVVQ